MSNTKTPETDSPPESLGSAAALKKQAVHEGITLPSGAVVTIKLPNINKMIRAGELPNELVEAAIQSQGEEKITREMVEREWDFIEYIVPLTLVKPKVTAEDVAEIDPNDAAMIAAFAARRIDTDAVGHQLGGLETQASFRKARGLVSLDEALADLP